MLDLWVAAGFGALALEAAGWWLGAAGERWLEGGAAAVASYFVEDGFWAGTAGSSVAQLLASVVAAFQWSAAYASADVLCFDQICWRRSCRSKRA